DPRLGLCGFHSILDRHQRTRRRFQSGQSEDRKITQQGPQTMLSKAPAIWQRPVDPKIVRSRHQQHSARTQDPVQLGECIEWLKRMLQHLCADNDVKSVRRNLIVPAAEIRNISAACIGIYIEGLNAGCRWKEWCRTAILLWRNVKHKTIRGRITSRGLRKKPPDVFPQCGEMK